MALVYVEEALKLTGKSRAKLYKMMKAGELSFSTDVDGRRKLDTAELVRVFGALQSTKDGQDIQPHTTLDGAETVGVTPVAVLETELKAARQQIEAMQQLLDAKEAHIQDMRQAMLLLENKVNSQPTPVENNKGFLKRLFG